MGCIIAHILTVVKFQTSAAECVPQTLPSPSASGEGRVVIPRNLRHDAPSALRGEHHPAALWGATTRRAVLPQQVARGPVKARACSAEHASLRSKAAPSRGNQFPLDTRLRRDTPSALRGGHHPAALWGATTRRAVSAQQVTRGPVTRRVRPTRQAARGPRFDFTSSGGVNPPCGKVLLRKTLGRRCRGGSLSLARARADLAQQMTRSPVTRRVLFELGGGLLALVGGVGAAGVEPAASGRVHG